MRIAIAGANETVGAEAVRVLRARGHDVRMLSSGPGLAEALIGVQVVVDASRSGFVDGTRRLLSAEREAGVGHHVGVSLIGVDRVGGPYSRRKLAQEAAIRAGGVPWATRSLRSGGLTNPGAWRGKTTFDESLSA